MTQLWPPDYSPRNGQVSNQIYPAGQLAMPHCPNTGGINYLSSGNYPYSAVSSSYMSYATALPSGHNATGSPVHLSHPGQLSMPYHMQPQSSTTLPSQHRSMSHHPYYPASPSHYRLQHQNARFVPPTETTLADTEEQESSNYESMRSEPLIPVLEGYPNVDEFDALMKEYVANLSPKKQDKALIHASRAANIKAVLIDKKTTSVESAQFRFWVKKMFTLEPKDASVNTRLKKICHEGKPVAIREKLFIILTRAHKTCQHGGRDKTSAQVRRVYSWVPKELISRFVKLCPTCQQRRGANRTSPSSSGNDTGTCTQSQSPDLGSRILSRRTSATASSTSATHSPLQMTGASLTFQHQNRWMTPVNMIESSERVGSLDAAASTMVNMNMHSPVLQESLASASSRYDTDSDTSYLSSHTMVGSTINPQYHSHGFNTGHSLNHLPQSEYSYRPDRRGPFDRN